MAPNAPAWLVARPIAHRGLHDERRGVVENTLPAAEAAIAGGFAIECDVQLSADGEIMVFHDETLDRLTTAAGALKGKTAQELATAAFKIGHAFVPRFQQLLDLVAGRTPIICEIKSDFDGDARLADAIAVKAGAYAGPLAIKSFDPAVVAHLRKERCDRPLGVVAEADYQGDYWRRLSPRQKSDCANFLHFPETTPDFLSFSVDDLPHPTPFLLRALRSTPVMVWTVRNAAQRAKAAQWADQIVFEGDAGGE
jgi:glycerophosphoryl diester phosphodiesterase